jgi:chromosome segregation ATPase
MKDKIFVLLDELVSMSGSSYTTESLNLELDEISKKIDKIKDRIAKKKNTVYDNKYLNVSEQMVDRNLQISLEQRINSLQNSIDDLEANIQTSLGKEQNNYNRISHLEKEITEGEKLISAFTIKKQKSNNKEVKATYESLLEDQRTRLDEQQKEYDLAIKEKNEIAEELSYLSATNNEQIDNLKDTKDKLDKIRTKVI